MSFFAPLSDEQPIAEHRQLCLSVEASMARSEFESAFQQASEAVQRYEVTGDSEGQALALYLLGTCCRHDLKVALAYLGRAQRIAEEQDSAPLLARVHETLAELHERSGDFPQALRSFRAFRDVEKRLLDAERAQAREENRRLQALAEERFRIDALTGIANRRYLEEQLTTEVERARRDALPLSVALLDIDHFRHINDAFGHRAGDAVLGQVAAILRDGCRTCSNDRAARYGGEEFVYLLPETNRVTALTLCERLREQIEAQNWSQIVPGLSSVTASIGVATMQGNDCAEEGLREWEAVLQASDLEPSVLSTYEVLALADKNLYAAKREGRNRVVGTDHVPTTTSVANS